MIKNALLVINMQNDYLCENRMKLFAYDTEGLVGRVNRLIHSYSKAAMTSWTPFWSGRESCGRVRIAERRSRFTTGTVRVARKELADIHLIERRSVDSWSGSGIS